VEPVHNFRHQSAPRFVVKAMSSSGAGSQWQLSSTDGEVLVKHEVATLSSMWALEDSDLLQFVSDILDLPEFEPAVLATFKLTPIKEETSKQLRRRSLANLKQARTLGFSTASKKEQASNEMCLCKSMNAGRKEMRNKHPCPSAQKGNESSLAMPDASVASPAPLVMAKTESCLPTVDGHPASIIAGIPPQEPNAISKTFLAGAASLGLRRLRSRATSEPPVQRIKRFHVPASKEKHTMMKGKDEAHLNEGFAVLKETMKMPHAPQRPQPAGYRKRPHIHGVPVLVFCDSASWK